MMPPKPLQNHPVLVVNDYALRFQKLLLRIRSSKAVSYTHLDVYKRQAIIVEKVMENRRQRPTLIPETMATSMFCPVVRISCPIFVLDINAVRRQSRAMISPTTMGICVAAHAEWRGGISQTSAADTVSTTAAAADLRLPFTCLLYTSRCV